jgi:predicted amidohydrolase
LSQRILRVAIIQSRIAGGAIENFKRVRDMASTASSPEIMAIYENWLGRTPISMEKYVGFSREILDVSGARVLVAGSAYIDIGGSIVSKSAIIDKGGSIAVGGKIFPSAATGERSRVLPGDPPAIFKTIYGYSIASVICVDAMYPEIVRIASLAGSYIVFNPSIIPSNRSYLWRALGASRASENTIFFIHVNATNTKYVDGRDVMGGSFIADPQGRISFEVGSGEGVFEASIDLGEVDRIRTRWRYLEDIRASLQEIYKIMFERSREFSKKASANGGLGALGSI